MGNGEWGMGNGEWGMGYGVWGIGFWIEKFVWLLVFILALANWRSVASKQNA